MKSILVGCLLLCAAYATIAWSAPHPDAPQLQLRTRTVSDRDLLGARARLATHPDATRRASAQTRTTGDMVPLLDTLRVAVIRCEFIREEPDDPNTSGDGHFDLSSDSPYLLDPPPHDGAYFQRQLLALRNYFAAVSAGRFQIETTLLPPGNTDAFELPQLMRYYNPDTTQAALDIRLAEFFRDCVQVADTTGVDFAGFDAVMIFHAGVGQDLLVDDPTPSDIPSAFISMRELQAALAPDDPDYPGIPVDGGEHHIRDGLWAPETENQEGIEFSMYGVMVNLMGSQIGLPSLFNTSSGAPGIGRFGLMDQGAGNELGKLPAAPCAWSRFFAGWENPVIVQSATGARVGATLSNVDQPTLYMIPIDSREYYLIENRQQDLDGDGGFTLVDSMGTIVGVVANEYDGAIPGSGMLIWHIDEEVIAAGLPDNTVNADFNHRGVDLEEADEIEDIGLRPSGGFGLDVDAFFDPNATRFGPRTHPSTLSNRNHETHILVDDISTSQMAMSFDVSIDIAQSGWPDTTSLNLDAVSLSAGDLEGDGPEEVALVTADGQLIVRRGDGSAAFAPVQLGSEARGMPIIVDLDVATDGAEVVAPSSDGVRVLRADGTSDPALAGWQRDLAPAPGTDVAAISYSLGGGAPAVAALAMIGENASLQIWRADGPTIGAFVGVESRSNITTIHEEGGRTRLLTVSGNQLLFWGFEAISDQVALPVDVGTGPLWILPAPFDDGTALWIVEREGGSIHAIDLEGNQLPGWPRRTRERHAGPPALADVRGDGHIDLLVPGEGRVWALAQTGALLEGWPVQLDTAATGLVLEGGVLASDLDADGRLDVAVTSPAGGLVAFDRSGRPLGGWPLASGPGNAATALLADLDGDEDIEIVAADGTGWLYAYDVAGPSGHVDGVDYPVWGERGERRRGYRYDNGLPPGAPSSSLLAEDSITIYPNPTRGAAAIRYEIGGSEDAEVTLLIFDATGHTVREFQARGLAGALNEIQWNGEDADGDAVPSGVYPVRITARTSAQSAQTFSHVAVTR